MANCNDPKTANLLHAYEMQILTDEDRSRLEIHLLECVECHSEKTRLDEAAELIRSDEDVKKVISGIVKEAVKPESKLAQIWELLWPKSPRFGWMRPVPVAVLLLVAMVGYQQLDPNGESPADQTLNLFPSRGRQPHVLNLVAGDRAEIFFIYDGAIEGSTYQIEITSSDGSVVYTNDSFTGFVRAGLGSFIVSLDDFAEGRYKLSIIDPSAEPPGNREEYLFSVTANDSK